MILNCQISKQNRTKMELTQNSIGYIKTFDSNTKKQLKMFYFFKGKLFIFLKMTNKIQEFFGTNDLFGYLTI